MYLLCSAKWRKDRQKADKFNEVDEREEGQDKNKDRPIKIMQDESNHNKTDSNKLLSPKGGEIENGESRSGANSPSPSDGMLEDAYNIMCSIFYSI